MQTHKNIPPPSFQRKFSPLFFHPIQTLFLFNKNSSLKVFPLFLSDNNKSLAPTYDIGWKFFDVMVKNHIWQYNYTLNPDGIFGAIKYMYTYYPDPNNRSHIREEFINVSLKNKI